MHENSMLEIFIKRSHSIQFTDTKAPPGKVQLFMSKKKKAL